MIAEPSVVSLAIAFMLALCLLAVLKEIQEHPGDDHVTRIVTVTVAFVLGASVVFFAFAPFVEYICSHLQWVN